MRHANHHARQDDFLEDSDAIGFSEQRTAELVPLGVAQELVAAPAAQVSRYSAPQQTTTHPAPMSWNPYAGLPDYLADQLTPGLADRTGWSFFQWMQDRHLIPAVGVLAGDVCGWGAAATEPMHPWFGAVFLGFGIIGSLAYVAIHTIRAINGEEGPLSPGAHAVGLFGTWGAAFGTACITGLSFLSAGVTLPFAAGSFYAWFQNRHSRLQDQRDFLVGQTAAATPAVVGMPGGGIAAPAAALPGKVLSHEESLVWKAFEGDGDQIKGIGVKLTDVYGFERINESSFRITVRLAAAKGVGPDAIIARRDEVRSALGANQIIAQRTRNGNEVRLTVRYGEIDELAENIPFPGITVHSIKEPIPLGPSATGETTYLPLHRNHTVIGGTTNNGKSGVVNVIAVQVMAMDDALLILLDNKPGALELGIYEEAAYASADSFEKAALILEAMVAVINTRGAILKRKRQESGQSERSWDTSDGPALVGIIDEIAELFRKQSQTDLKKYANPVLRRAVAGMSTNYVRIMQVGRAYDVVIEVATQKPDALATGGIKSGTDQAQNRICVPTVGPRLTNIVLYDGAHGDNFRANELDTPGKFYMVTLRERVPVERKAFWLTDERIAQYVEEYKDEQPQLDEESDAAFQAIMNGVEPEITTPPPFDGGPDGSGEEPVDAVNDTPARGGTGGWVPRLVSKYPDDSEIEAKHLPYWELLATFGDRGTLVSELWIAGKRAGHDRSLAWVRDLCAQWRTAGYVVSEQQGRDFRYWRDDNAVRRQLLVQREA
jgi:hypothetical protein